VGVRDAVGVRVAVAVGVAVGVDVAVAASGVSVAVGVSVSVGVTVAVGVSVAVTVGTPAPAAGLPGNRRPPARNRTTAPTHTRSARSRAPIAGRPTDREPRTEFLELMQRGYTPNATRSNPEPRLSHRLAGGAQCVALDRVAADQDGARNETVRARRRDGGAISIRAIRSLENSVSQTFPSGPDAIP